MSLRSISDLEVQSWAKDLRAQMGIVSGKRQVVYTRAKLENSLRSTWSFDERTLEIAMRAADTVVLWAEPEAENEFGPVCP